ncbi:MAG: AsmA family protein [Deltaproteobacteria bacterium]|nr:AsmA family protein [Deltaproteobacteria bacterium]
MKRLLKILGIAAAVVGLLLGAAVVVLWLFVDLDQVVNEQIAKAKPQIEQRLGRKVEVGKVTTRLFPVLGGRIEGLAIASDPTRPEDDRPLLHVGSVGFDVALWRAVSSFGKSIVVKDVYVDGLQVSVVRYKDGRLSYQDILDRQPREPESKRSAAPSEPLSPQVLEYLRAVSIDELRLFDAEVRFADHATPTGKVAEERVRRLNLALRDLRLSDPIRLKLTAALFAEATNLELEASVGPLPQDLKLEGLPPIGGVRLRAEQIDLGKLAPYLGPAVPVRIQSALLSSSLDVGEVGKAKPVTVSGSLTIAGLQLSGGQKLDVKLDTRLKANLQDLGVDIDKLDLKVGAIELAMSGALLDLAKTPRFKDFTIRSTTLDPALLFAYYPAAAQGLPPGTRLAGPIRLEVKASGDASRQTVLAEVDLAALDLLLPDTLLKPKDTPFALKVDGDFTSSDANLRRMGLVLDELDLGLRGTVKDFHKPTLDLALEAKPFSFDRLARLIPSIGEALRKASAKASGDGQLAGHIKGTAEDLDAALQLALLGVKLDVPGTRLDGDLRLDVKAKGNPKQDLQASLRLDANEAVIRVEGAVDKAAHTPLLVEVEAQRKGDLLELRRLGVVFAELKLDAKGRFDLAKGESALSVAMQRLDLEKFAKTVTAIPADRAKKGFVDAKVTVSGNPNRLDSMAIELNPLSARLGRSDLLGQVKVVNLTRPQAQVNLTSQLLDLDELNGARKEPEPSKAQTQAQPAAEKRPPAKDDPSLKDYRLSGRVDLKRVIVSQTELTDFKGEIELIDGVLTLKDCTLHAFDGTVSAQGTRAEIWKARMPFTANLAIKGMDLNKVLSAKTRYANTLHGKADLDVQAHGEGFETEELEQKLLGSMSVKLNEGKLARASLTKAVLGDFALLEKVPGVSTSKALKSVSADNAIRDLAAQLEIKDGKLQLARPVAFNLDGNRVQLGGAVGIAGKLLLQGDYFVPPSLVNTLTAGKCKSDAELKVPVSIAGTVSSPEFRPEASAVVEALLQRCLKGAAAQAVGDQAGKLLGDQAKKVIGTTAVPTSTAEAEARAKAEADRLKAESEAKARAEADRLKAEAEARVRAEADKRKKAAEEAAKKEAGNALKGIFGNKK